MPMQIREMASTSVLRFLPSGESTNQMRKRYKEWWAEIIEDYNFAVENARKHKLAVQIRELINIGFIVSGPFLAILALIFKIANIDLRPDNIFTFDNGFDGWILFMLTYLGFVNQIASIRKVRLIEMHALQHFVFRCVFLSLIFCFILIYCIVLLCFTLSFLVGKKKETFLFVAVFHSFFVCFVETFLSK